MQVTSNSGLAGFRPDWPAPQQVAAFCAHRQTNSTLDFRQAAGKQALAAALKLAQPPHWLRQVHGSVCIETSSATQTSMPQADAAYSGSGQTCAVLTADCLPLLLCSSDGNEIAAVHAGWRGLLQGVIGASVLRFKAPRSEILVWLGPAISQAAFEVGEEVRAQFLMVANPAEIEITRAAFESGRSGRYYADLYALARIRLKALGVMRVYGGGFCTVRDAERFHSYRRDGELSGRMASVIWTCKAPS